jgi:GTPase SAR1 family protein
MNPIHTYDIQIMGDRYVGKTKLFNMIANSRPPPVLVNQVVIPLAENSLYTIPVKYQLWDISDMKGWFGKMRMNPKPDITLIVIDPSRPETLTNAAEKIIPISLLEGTRMHVVLINHIPNTIEKMTLIHVRDYIQVRCKLDNPVYIFESDLSQRNILEEILRKIICIRHQSPYG